MGKFSPDRSRETASPLQKISSSSCAVIIVVAKTVSFYPSWSHLPWSVIIWRTLRTRFSAPFELFSHLLWLLDASLQLQKKSGIYLHVICLRMIRFQTFTLLLLHYYEYWLFNARHSLNIQINMPAPLTQVEELWVLKHLGNIKGIFFDKGCPWRDGETVQLLTVKALISDTGSEGLENLPGRMKILQYFVYQGKA